MQAVKTWDVIVVGGGIIGLSLSLALRKKGASVLVVERGEPGREASYSAAGMLADCPIEMPQALRELAAASARMYPEFAHELQDESGIDVDLRDQGTLYFASGESGQRDIGGEAERVSPAGLAEMEPALAAARSAWLLRERSVDPRSLVAATLKAAKHRGVDVSSGTAVTEVVISEGRAAGVKTEKTSYAAPAIVNCAGAWAGKIGPYQFPVRPVKGQILSVVGVPALRHVIRAPGVYLVPRSDGRVLIGATLEEVGYDKKTDPDTIQSLHQAANLLVPALAEGKILEAWAGLRPGTPDDLPILGKTEVPGYFVAAGHFRNGVLLAPVTVAVMVKVVAGKTPEYDISAFSALRFAN
jgi:glycine oxidase